MIEDRLKERLTGAAIVVALMVLLVPEMFHGRPQGAPASGGSTAGGPPLRSYTIDLKDGAVPAAGGAASTSATPALAPPPELAAPATTAPAALAPTATAPATTAPTATLPAGGPPAPAAAATGGVAASPPATAAPPPVQPVPAAASPAAPQGGSSAESGADRYQVQLGLFASRDNADRLAARAARLGVRALVSGPDARGLYRVHTATYGSRAGALAMQQKLREAGLSSALTPQR